MSGPNAAFRGELLVVMYHFVRPLPTPGFPELRALSLELFEDQLIRLKQTHVPVSAAEVKAAIALGEPLPDRGVILTFDDGYRDHCDHAAPLMLKHGFTGAFYPPASSTLHREILDVNKIQFVLATGVEPDILAERIDGFVETGVPGLKQLAEYRGLYLKPGRWDCPRTNYVKKMLQTGLPHQERRKIINDLFAEFVTTDEKQFADELYLSVEDLRQLELDGMHVGGHSSSHHRLAALTEDELAHELAETLDLLHMLEQSDGVRSFCYPYGSYDDRSVQALTDHDFDFSFSTEARIARIGVDHPMAIPRLDTNDLR